MEKDLKRISIFIIFILYSNLPFAAIKKKSSNPLYDILDLKRRIFKLDKKISIKKNNEYLKVIKKRQFFNMEIYEIKIEVSRNLEFLEKKRKNLNLRLKQFLLNYVDLEGGNDLIEHKMLLAEIVKKKKEIVFHIKGNKSLQVKMNSLVKKYEKRVEIEKEIFNLIKKMEKSKGDYVNSYLLKKSKIGKGHLKKRNNISKNKRNIPEIFRNISFEKPVSNYQSYTTKDNKGITYFLNSQSKIKAARKGIVAYVAPLLNYGNLIMINHENKIKTLYLGDLISLVKKGEKVKIGQIIAKTMKTSKEKKLYFEVREKEISQNTIQLVRNMRKIKMEKE